MGALQDISARLEELEKKLAGKRQSLEHQYDLLEKAESRSRKEPDKRAYWYEVFDNLEDSIAETKGSIATLEQLIRETRKQSEKLQEGGETAAVGPKDPILAALEEAGLDEDTQLEMASISAAEKLLAIPVEVMMRLSLEDVAKLHEHMITQAAEQKEAEDGGAAKKASEPGKPSSSLRDRLAARREGVQTRRKLMGGGGAQQQSFNERLKQKMLREALEKACKGQLDMMSVEEIDALTNYHEILSRRKDPSETDVKLKQTLDGRIEGLNERAAELRRRKMKRPFPRS